MHQATTRWMSQQHCADCISCFQQQEPHHLPDVLDTTTEFPACCRIEPLIAAKTPELWTQVHGFFPETQRGPKASRRLGLCLDTAPGSRQASTMGQIPGERQHEIF